MQSKQNGRVTYLALQRLVENAWVEQDLPRLLRLPSAGRASFPYGPCCVPSIPRAVYSACKAFRPALPPLRACPPRTEAAHAPAFQSPRACVQSAG